MSTVKCLRSFMKYKVGDRPIFAQGVKDGVYGNTTVFPAPPIVEGDFQGAIDNFIEKRALYVNGGSAQKPGYEAANTALMDALNQTADYVDTLVNGDPNMVILAGYKPTKSTKSDVAKPLKIEGVTVVRTNVSGMLVADCKPQDGVNTYVCILTQGMPLPETVTVSKTGQIIINDIDAPTGNTGGSAQSTSITGVYADLNQYRKKEFLGLTPLQTYYCVFFGINAGGVGAMSDPVSIICV
jgi:hypothetical protein